jgi:hypothetical protein
MPIHRNEILSPCAVTAEELVPIYMEFSQEVQLGHIQLKTEKFRA